MWESSPVTSSRSTPSAGAPFPAFALFPSIRGRLSCARGHKHASPVRRLTLLMVVLSADTSDTCRLSARNVLGCVYTETPPASQGGFAVLEASPASPQVCLGFLLVFCGGRLKLDLPAGGLRRVVTISSNFTWCSAWSVTDHVASSSTNTSSKGPRTPVFIAATSTIAKPWKLLSVHGHVRG